jgi:SH3 domain-containing YSC84-like protein 1
MNKIIAFMLTILLIMPVAAQAEDRYAYTQEQSARARMQDTKDRAPYHIMVDDASELYAAITKGPHGEVPDSVLKNARCIAVLPEVLTGAFVIGGTHGSGLVSCKDNQNKWSHPAAITLSQGSVGLQAGAKSVDLVLFFQSKEAEQALKRGDFKLGADVSAVAGVYDSKANLPNAGVIVYTRSRGLYAGAAVNGSKIGKNQDELTSYYGRKVDYLAILEGRELPDTANYGQKLTQLFPTT